MFSIIADIDRVNPSQKEFPVEVEGSKLQGNAGGTPARNRRTTGGCQPVTSGGGERAVGQDRPAGARVHQEPLAGDVVP
jgi:hypothetical protein